MVYTNFSSNQVPLTGGQRYDGFSHPSSYNFKITFSNIRGIHSNLHDIHQFLQHSSPDCLFLSETQIKEPLDSTHLKFPGYTLYSIFQAKGGICAYIKSNLVSCQMPKLNIIQSRFQSSWIQIKLHNNLKFICFLYRSPNDSNFTENFSLLSNQIEDLLKNYPLSEIIVLGDFNVHNSSWLSHSFSTDTAGREAEQFSILNCFSQLVCGPTRIPDNGTDHPQTLDLFLSNKSDNYYTPLISSPLGSSDHCLIQVQQAIPPPSKCVPNKKTVWKYESADWDGLRDFIAVFPWKEACFSSCPSATASSISEIILLGMDMFIPKQSKNFKASSPSWFNSSCQAAVKKKNLAFKNWKSNPTPLSHSHYTQYRNACKATIASAKEAFVHKIAGKLSEAPSHDRRFWSLAKSIS